MDIKHLQYFIEVSRLKSFSKAADYLYVTQPTISKMIKNLESELGVTSFDRTSKKVTLTDAGHVIYSQANLINKAFKDLELELECLLDLKKGHISIGLPPMIGSVYFSEIIGRFHEQYPDLSIQLLEDGSRRIEEEIDKGNLDIGVVALPVDKELFHTLPFVKETIKLIIPSVHHFADLYHVKLEQLKEENFILFNEEFALHNHVISSCKQAGFMPRIVSKSSQWDFIGKMVNSNLGISFMPESICKGLEDQVSIIDVIDPTIHWELAIIWRKDKYLSYAAKEWLRFTKEQLN